MGRIRTILRRSTAVRERRIVTVRFGDVYTRPDRTLERVAGALQARGVRARMRGVGWQRHFPVRQGA